MNIINFYISLFFILLMQTALPQELPKITVFIHGTLPPVINQVIHALEAPLGLTKATALQSGIIHKQIAATLSKADSKQFPVEHFYFFGWSGHLSVSDRRNEAHNLYHELQKLNGKITLICHSHGCNVALNLAAITHDHVHTKDLLIDKLILLAGPVQDATKKYVHSPIFKQIYSFYSIADMIQVIDPQGLQRKNFGKREKDFFSTRLWPESKNLIQTEVYFGKKTLWHLDFMLKDFLRYLPKTIRTFEKMSHKNIRTHFSLDINKNQKSFTIKHIS